MNRPLGPHQFDERGLGLSDGDLVLNHLERVAYIIKGGEPVKLANFGERSDPASRRTMRHPAAAAASPVGSRLAGSTRRRACGPTTPACRSPRSSPSTPRAAR